MDPLARHLLAHAYHNAWANHRLLGACEQLAQTEFEALRVGFFPSIRATLNHALTVDWYDIDAIERGLRGDPPNPAWAACFEPELPHADHRGQAHAMLSGSSVAPPQLDEFFCAGAGDAARRAPDFAARGWTEAAIWGAPE